jgi:hypothetical protein
MSNSFKPAICEAIGEAMRSGRLQFGRFMSVHELSVVYPHFIRMSVLIHAGWMNVGLLVPRIDRTCSCVAKFAPAFDRRIEKFSRFEINFASVGSKSDCL